ncbi:fructose-specific PTS transporter subunit EIIC [Thomasclavelia cocleata]|jgi:PTS system fructose-specific IIC component|uniref:fructose-specific PTS transporter subunit EIIC n=2 Tax=Thomasclavelia cocleata TaxID=69824 RepID=UPI00242ED449|nr:fructose-specific PTS transporter subunit EIIC [Thomasclavelia cocleata]MCI9631089.1 PTS transporter subunit EIIA [Thomasclavelia cocleata]
MKLTELLCLERIDLNANVINKNDVINYLIELMMVNDNIIDKNVYKQEILNSKIKNINEIMDGITILYTKTEAVNKPGISVIAVKNKIDYDSLDEFSTRLIFMIVMPDDNEDLYLDIIQQLSQMLMDYNFKEQLINASSSNEFLSLISMKELEIEKIIEKPKDCYEILAVTACPLGIVQTFTAAKSLEKMANKMNILFKVEIQSATVFENILTKDEIKNAKCIIVVADKHIDMSRFNGKRVVMAKITDGINNAEMLLKQAFSNETPIYNFQTETNKKTDKNLAILKTLYAQLSEGINKILPILVATGALISIATLAVSYDLFNISSLVDNVWIANSYVFGNAIQGMVVALLAGFIGNTISSQIGFASGFCCGVATQLNSIYLNDPNNPGILGGIIAGFIGGYMVIAIQKLCKDMPKQFDEVKSMIIYPILSIMIGGLITYLLSPYMGDFNHIIAVFIAEMSLLLKLLLGIIIGIMMTIDMKGPTNKMAYIFGISQILEGNIDVMAAVMAGGMVPPLAIAVATSLFEDKFTNQEIVMGQENFLKGLLFIFDGITPLIYKDFQLVRVTCIAASSIASGLVMIYNCGIMIPQGGIFVLPLMVHPLRFLVALLAGSICGGAIYGLWKEKK